MTEILEAIQQALLLVTQIITTSWLTFGMYKATRYKWTWTEKPLKDAEGNIVREGVGEYTSRDIFWFVKVWGDKHLPWWISKPLYDCPPCMGSFWSIMTSILFGFSWWILLIIPCVTGINYITINLFPYSED